jgi:hypothetical protein
MIFGFGFSLESLMPAEAEWRSRAIFPQLFVLPVGQRTRE